MEQNLKNNMYYSHDEHDEKNDFSASIYQSFPGQDRFGFPEYLARVTSGYGGETFLIFGSEKTALYDCGMAYSANSTIDNIHRELKSHGRIQLDIILLSHTHYDHIGALPYILKEWPAATVYAAEKAKSVFESEGARKTMERLGESAYHEFKAAYGNEFEKYEVPEIITDGLRVDIVCKDDDFIDLGLYCGNLPVRRTGVEDIVAFAFLPLDVGIAGTRAPEHVDHRAVKYMLSRVRRLVFSFVM